MSSWNPFSKKTDTDGVVDTLKNDYTINDSIGVWELSNVPKGLEWKILLPKFREAIPGEMYYKRFAGDKDEIIPAGTPYGFIVDTEGKKHQLLMLTDGRKLLTSEFMSGGARKKRRTMHRKNKARRQSRKFR